MRSLRDALLSPAAFPLPVERVDYLETHISMLYFAGGRVYKVKRPVELPFLDFRDVDRRRFFCEEEVRLNRRLAPEVYLGVVPVRRSASGRVTFGGDGEAIDWAVEMTRLPEDRMLSELLERGELDNALLSQLVERLVTFHAAAPTGGDVDGFGSPGAVTKLVTENLDELSALAGAITPSGPALCAFLKTRANAFLRDHRWLLARRVEKGRIRDGHGDLHAGNIAYVDGGVVAYDCIEFSPAFRASDVACDLAFLAMDLDHRGYPGFAGYLARRYAEVADDHDLLPLMRFYKGYRAAVRAKVAALTAQGAATPDEREAARRQAADYLALAISYELPPALVLMCGLPGTGKTWLGRRIAERTRGVMTRSDVRRKQLAGVRQTDHKGAAFQEGLYSPAMTARTYATLAELAAESLARGRTVVADAAFSKRSERDFFALRSKQLGHPAYVVQTTAPDRIVRQRLIARAAAGSDASDAGVAVYERARETFEPPDEVPDARRLVFDSASDAAEDFTCSLLERMTRTAGDGENDMQNDETTFFAAVDQNSARFMACTRTEHDRVRVEEIDALTDDWEEREHGRPSPRSGRQGHNSAAFAHEDEEHLRRFAKAVAGWLEPHVAERGLDRIDLCSSTRLLGELRRELTPTLKRVVVVHDADIAHLSPSQMLPAVERLGLAATE